LCLSLLCHWQQLPITWRRCNRCAPLYCCRKAALLPGSLNWRRRSILAPNAASPQPPYNCAALLQPAKARTLLLSACTTSPTRQLHFSCIFAGWPQCWHRRQPQLLPQDRRGICRPPRPLLPPSTPSICMCALPRIALTLLGIVTHCAIALQNNWLAHEIVSSVEYMSRVEIGMQIVPPRFRTRRFSWCSHYTWMAESRAGGMHSGSVSAAKGGPAYAECSDTAKRVS
jgi:hypothetical protein